MKTDATAADASGNFEADRARHAWLANKKQDLLAPAGAILELSELLAKDARDRGNEALAKDLSQMQIAGQRLLAMVQGLLEPGQIPKDLDAARRLRHDLRTPMTLIIGLTELWLEDADNVFLEKFAEDFHEIHRLSDKLLTSIDALLGFGKMATDEEIDQDSLPMIQDVVDSLPPLIADRGRAAETGALLVVDDNEDNRELLRRRLERSGHTVTTANNGRQALDILAKQAFDVILLDIIMPEMNGFQVLERLKADESRRHIPVIMISAFGDIDSVVRCIERGAEDYLAKPFNPVLLQARLSACLEKKRLRDREVHYLEQIKKEQQRADELLHVILPAQIVEELKKTNTVQPRRFDQVAVLFCDIVGFTPYCDRSQPEDVVKHLQQLIEAWEEIALRHQVDKIKTIGDAFMAAAGLLTPTLDPPALHCIRCGLEMIAACQSLPTEWNLRVGIHVGPVVAGVIGRRQYLFDLWGDTVNTAARMESNGVPGHVVLSGPAWKTIALHCHGESRGILTIKGKGQMEMVRFDSFRERPS